MNGQRVYAVGDSHAFFNYTRIEPVTVVYLGAFTMHRIGRDGFDSVLPADLHFLPGDIVISSYGDIDCSAHVMPIAVLKDWTWEEVIDDLVYRYMQTLIKFKGRSEAQVGVNCISPPGVRFAGQDLKNQVIIRKMMNAKLASYCEQVGFEFIDFYDKYEAADGSMFPADKWAGNHMDPDHSEFVLSALRAKYDVPFTYKTTPVEIASCKEWGK
jgi:hypothetical protein